MCDVQCRGHWEAQRRYPDEAAAGPVGTYPEELTDDQVAYIHERAEQRREVWRDHTCTLSTSNQTEKKNA